MPASAGSVGDALGGALDALAAAGVSSPRLDAELLLAEATGLDRAALVADPRREVDAGPGRAFAEMVRRRLRREPVAYILGRKGFRHIELAVDRRVLIPRPETELLVELAIELVPRTALDVGSGSGAIALAVAEELPLCALTATDTSPGALEVAAANARALGLEERVRLLAGSLPRGERFDLVLANLPYVAEREWASLAPEITKWEPREALLAGPEGLDAIGDLLGRVRAVTREAGQNQSSADVGAAAVGLEVGEGQADRVAELLGEAGFGTTEVRRDLAGVKRLVVGRA